MSKLVLEEQACHFGKCPTHFGPKITAKLKGAGSLFDHLAPYLVQYQKCGGCRHVLYCSKECQKADWPEHRAHCKHMTLHKKDLDNIDRKIRDFFSFASTNQDLLDFLHCYSQTEPMKSGLAGKKYLTILPFQTINDLNAFRLFWTLPPDARSRVRLEQRVQFTSQPTLEKRLEEQLSKGHVDDPSDLIITGCLEQHNPLQNILLCIEIHHCIPLPLPSPDAKKSKGKRKKKFVIPFPNQVMLVQLLSRVALSPEVEHWRTEVRHLLKARFLHGREQTRDTRKESEGLAYLVLSFA
jgi:hypothetical protein